MLELKHWFSFLFWHFSGHKLWFITNRFTNIFFLKMLLHKKILNKNTLHKALLRQFFHFHAWTDRNDTFSPSTAIFSVFLSHWLMRANLGQTESVAQQQQWRNRFAARVARAVHRVRIAFPQSLLGCGKSRAGKIRIWLISKKSVRRQGGIKKKRGNVPIEAKVNCVLSAILKLIGDTLRQHYPGQSSDQIARGTIRAGGGMVISTSIFDFWDIPYPPLIGSLPWNIASFSSGTFCRCALPAISNKF